MEWTKAKQDAARRKHMSAVLVDLGQYIVDHAEEITEMAHSRHERGFAQYGEEMFLWDKRTWMLNLMEELADAGNYGCAGYARGWRL